MSTLPHWAGVSRISKQSQAFWKISRISRISNKISFISRILEDFLIFSRKSCQLWTNRTENFPVLKDWIKTLSDFSGIFPDFPDKNRITPKFFPDFQLFPDFPIFLKSDYQSKFTALQNLPHFGDDELTSLSYILHIHRSYEPGFKV